MAPKASILEASAKHPKPESDFQYGTAGVSLLWTLRESFGLRLTFNDF
jgi:hypothetical protein